MSSWLDLIAGMAFFVLSVVAARTSKRLAFISGLTGVAWFAGDVWSWALFVHRPLELQAALGYPDGRTRGSSARGLLAVGWVAALIQPLGRNTWLMLTFGCLILGQSILRQRQSGHSRGAELVTSSRAVALVALSLLLPAAARLAIPGWIAEHHRGLALYDGLTSLTALTMICALILRAANGQADEVIELSEATPRQTLDALRIELAARREAPGAEQLRTAAQLLQANEDLHSTLRRNADEVRLSRSRLVNAADAERKRLENVLAAGALTFLQELAGTFRRLEERVDDETARLIRAGLDEIERSCEELELLAAGLHPRLLVQQGLRAALSDLAARSPTPLTVDVPAQRFSESAETALWYACAEATANIVKHARASQASIQVRQDADSIVAHIRDDGVGGARVSQGGGLAGLVDRLSAVDGVVVVGPGIDGGTHLQIRVPLA